MSRQEDAVTLTVRAGLSGSVSRAQAIVSFLAKAEESLAGAESELANHRYNNCANRCYYACFQATIAALVAAGIQPRTQSGQWGHDYVASLFVQQLVNRRRVYPSDLRDTLERLFTVRQVADYRTDVVTYTQAVRGLRRTREFVRAVQARGEYHQ